MSTSRPMSFATHSPQTIDDLLAVNVRFPTMLTHHCISRLVKSIHNRSGLYEQKCKEPNPSSQKTELWPEFQMEGGLLGCIVNTMWASILQVIICICRLVTQVRTTIAATLFWNNSFPRSGIIFVSSQAGVLPAPQCSVYGASKSYIISLARSLRAELQPNMDIDVISVTPGMVNAGNTLHWFRPERLLWTDVASAKQVASGCLSALGSWSTHESPTWMHWFTLKLIQILPERLASDLVVTSTSQHTYGST